jgi:hypothetical protein
MIGNCILRARIGAEARTYLSISARGSWGRHFREAVIKTKLANILPNQDESDGAFDVGVACIC